MRRLPVQLVLGAGLTAVFVAAALLSFLWTPYAVDGMNIAARMQTPSGSTGSGPIISGATSCRC
jgi:peptide/nickel transport system permease protein